MSLFHDNDLCMYFLCNNVQVKFLTPIREVKAAPPPRPDCKPIFDFRLRPRDLQEHDNVRLSCIASGYPEPKVPFG